MATAKTTIELNGKLYDARTGKIIEGGAQTSTSVSTPKPAKPAHVSTGLIMDGVSRRPKNQVARATTKRKAAPAHAAAKLQKSKTLMRPAVKKPAVTVEATTIAKTSIKHEIAKKHDPARAARATVVTRSESIKKFNASHEPHKIIKKQAELVVAKPVEAEIVSKSVASAAPVHLADRVAHLATSTETHIKDSVDVIEESLRNASSHLQQFEEKLIERSFWEKFGFKHKVANIASLTLACLLLVGFFAYQNATVVEMKVAAARSGVAANVPSYKPAGFSASKNVKSEPGKVSLTFNSNTSDKKFTLSQESSNWSSDALLTNHVLASKQPFQTYQDEGKTVYIYNNSTATWVNGGVWYRVDGDASLTSDQLLRLASSL